MDYNFSEIERNSKEKWAKDEIYKVTEDPTRPKFYVLDMFPYPSGAGLHVGHPLGYVASDIYARYKRLKGYNVLHPMGYDAFGLPAEQYAIETGTPPTETTTKAIARYREQLDKIGFSFDWSRKVVTCEPAYYKWTQWIFLKLYGSWYNREKDKAESIDTLKAIFEKSGNKTVAREGVEPFTAEEWSAYNRTQKEKALMNYRLAFLSYAEVNWCEALGTVLANDEVKDGKSERGGHPVERRKMRQWFLRITEYSDRLLEGLNRLDWSDSMKEMQRNWIGRSEGALVRFELSLNHLSPTLSEGEGARARKDNTNSNLSPNPSPEERGATTPNDNTDEKGKPKYHTTDKDTWERNLPLAKEYRHEPTEAETIIWEELRDKRTGYKFRRQHPIDRYIPDFVCLEKGLIVEVDGDIHLSQQEEDKIRTEVLSQYGFEVIRFTNDEVLQDVKVVVEKIKSKLSVMGERKTSHTQDDSGEPAVKALSFGEGLGEVSEKNGGDSPSLSERGPGGEVLTVFTTRPDTIFGATFMVIAAEHEMVEQLTTPEQKEEVEKYIAYVKSRTDVERQQEKRVTGVFTGSYAINPFTNQPIPVWIAEYVLSGYGTGAIMAVPADDERDHKFATKFGLPIIEIIDRSQHPGAAMGDKVGTLINSGFLNGLDIKEAQQEILDEIEDRDIGERKVNYKQRDAGYSRQRYWGEPFPIRYRVVGEPDGHFEGEGESDDIPVPLNDSELPLVLPEVSSYKPTGDGRSPLANSAEWVKKNYETDTMPGYAGSSWYFLRYMDAQNPNEFAAKDKLDYWQNVDVYFGGAEHAVGHLLYSRMWHKFLYDLGYVCKDEPFQKLVNQGMIQGRSSFIFRLVKTNTYVSFNAFAELISYGADRENFTSESDIDFKQLWNDNEYTDADKTVFNYSGNLLWQQVKIWIGAVDSINGKDILNVNKLIEWRPEYQNAKFISDKEGFICGHEVEKMSKSKYNVVNPDDVIEKYGADCFRMFEMFLGPIEQSKPWDDKGISGVYNFLRKFWRLYTTPPNLPEGEGQGGRASGANIKGAGSPPSEGLGEVNLGTDKANNEELKVLHKTLKKIAEDIERLSFNTCVSAFMIATNELTALGCNKREVLEPLLIALAPFAPFITEELWAKLGHKESIHKASYPTVEEKYLVEDSFNYPVSINGKVRAQVSLSLTLEAKEVEQQILGMESIQKWTNGSAPKKFIFVKGKIINVVV